MNESLLKIIPPPRSPDYPAGVPQIATDTRFMIGDVELRSVERCTVTWACGEFLTATLDVAIDPGVVEADPLLSLESLRRAARHYGYRLEKEGTGRSWLRRLFG